MKKGKVSAIAGILVLALAAAPVPVLAAAPGDTASVSTDASTGEARTNLTLEKTEEVTPVYTVAVTANVSLSRDPQDLSFTMTNVSSPDSGAPMDKKVTVKIANAGYSGGLGKFAVWDSTNLNEASYEIYESDASATITPYAIGDEIACWDYGNHGSMTRRIRVLNYDSVKPGTYSGHIDYAISLDNVS